MFRSKTPVLDWLVAATVGSLTSWQATAQASVVTLLTNDGGEETSFNAAGHWSNSAAPSAGNDYVVSNNYILRTPAAYASYIFAGDSLTLSNGGQMRYKSGPAQTVTIGSLILDNGMVMDGTDSGVWELAGNITLNAGGGYFQPTSDGGTPNRVINVSAAISGTGLLTVNGAYSSGSYLMLSSKNTYSGGTAVMSGTTLYAAVNEALGTGNVTVGGTLSLNGLTNNIADTASMIVLSGGSVQLNNTTPDVISGLIANGTSYTAAGTYGAIGSGAMTELSCFSGAGLLYVPEPSMVVMMVSGLLACASRKRRK